MAWIKVDDQIAHHPKVLRAGLSAWLWICCIGFCQKFLTDGYIPTEAISTLSGGVRRPHDHVRRLVRCGLLEKVKDGYRVHDYLDHNDSAAIVRKKREEDRKRKVSERNPAGQAGLSGRTPSGVLARAPAPHPIRTDRTNRKDIRTSTSTAANKQPRARGTQDDGSETPEKQLPIYRGKRLVVFPWMRDDIRRILGQHAGDFELGKWFRIVDARASAMADVMPIREQWRWMLDQLVEDAAKTGLKVTASAPRERRQVAIFRDVDQFPENVWGSMLSTIAARVDRHTLHTWFLPISLAKDSKTAVTLTAPALVREWVEKHHKGELAAALDKARPKAKLRWQA